MKRVLFYFFLLLLTHDVQAEDVYLKTGKVVRAKILRRDGPVVFAKQAAPPEETSLIAVNQIEKIVFADSPELNDASAAAYAGDAQTVLNKTAGPLSYHNQWHDVPGNARASILRLVLQALIHLRKTAEIKSLIQTWIPTGDLDVEATAELLRVRFLAAEKDSFERAAISATAFYPGTLCAAVAWLELGNTHLATGQWSEAARDFLSVRLFSQGSRLLQAPALLGAVEACRGDDQGTQSIALIEDLLAEYPASEQARIAAALPRPTTKSSSR